MDSPRSPDPAPPAVPAASVPAAPPPGALDRLRRLLPLVGGLVRRTKRLAAVSAASAVVLWLALARPWRWGVDPPEDGYALAVVGLLVLLVPAGAALLGALTLGDLLRLPAQLRGAAAEAAGHARGALAGGPARGRLLGFARAIWGARALVLDAQGGWLKALALARLARLASLPFALFLVAAVALNFVVIAAAALAVLLALAL
jgi:hypothetical protein